MSIRLMSSSSLLVACGGLLLLGSLSGCQTTVNGQTLPSWAYLRDDVQFFPAGPEFQLSNEVRAIEEYNAAQESYASDRRVAP
ncbi:MAG: hypothetical protein KF861_01715 [Planctomycetaceae bacterium]|nr:hypothetical protein [Planctomycetaceae bacterium]